MCGICGFISLKIKPINKPGIIKKMLGVISHRGPDDEGAFAENHAALGVRRLSIIDLNTGHQPIHNEDSSLWIVHNGEIYNFPELREFLIKKGHVFYTKSDTEVIIHLYEEYGYECLSKLYGMFAFAIWDKKKNELFIARDRFGIKPLYYSDFDAQLLFASEAKSILQFPGFNKGLDLAALDQYLTFEYVPSPRSIFQKIRKLQPGHYLIYKNQNVHIRKYWDIGVIKAENFLKEIEAEEKLLGLLKNSVKRHLISDVPIGVFLSGGIDSSFITALASNFSNGGIKTFSIGFKDDSFDESRYIKQVAHICGSRHYHRIFDLKDLCDLIPKTAGFLDEPLADASFFPAFLLAKSARQEVTVALSGEGGDELFAGYPTYQAHKFAKYYRMIPLAVRENIIKRIVMNLPVSMKNFSFDFKAKRFVLSVDLPFELRHIYWMGAFNQQDKALLYGPALKQLVNSKNINEVLNNCFSIFQADGELNKLQYLDIKTYLEGGLLTKSDRASMINSLEMRVPYLDHKLVEFMFSLPPALRLNNFKSKYILKNTARNILPKNIINRRKKGFGIPLAFWINDKLKSLILDVLAKDKIKKEGLFNYRFIEVLLKRHFSNKEDNHKRIWTLFMFELWLEEYGNTSTILGY